jgi:enterochelin esterase-like enzyme
LLAASVTTFLHPPQASQKQGDKPAGQEPKRTVRMLPPWKLPYEILPAPADASGLAGRLNGKDSAVWLEGDVMTILHRDATADQLMVTGSVQQPMKRIPGTDLWIIQLKMPNWEEAFFSYGFMSLSAPPGTRVTFDTWYGPKSPRKPTTAQTLQGKLVQRTLHSASLGEDRNLTIYLPPNAHTRDLPAFFMGDGQGCEAFAKVLEPLILAGRVRPCAIVGVFSAEYKGKPGAYDPKLDFRGLEYLHIEAPDRFGRHMTFFTQEVLDHVAKEFGISKRRNDLALFGFSNGGAFAAAVGVLHPEIFGTVMPFSPGLPPPDKKPAGKLPAFYFSAGKLESFSRATTAAYEQAKGWGVNTTLDLYLAGHDPEQWHMAFANLAPKVFPPVRSLNVWAD